MNMKIKRMAVKLNRTSPGRLLVMAIQSIGALACYEWIVWALPPATTILSMISILAVLLLLYIAIKAISQRHIARTELKYTNKLMIKYRALSVSTMNSMREMREQTTELRKKIETINQTKYN
jgi:hypothetical protein